MVAPLATFHPDLGMMVLQQGEKIANEGGSKLLEHTATRKLCDGGSKEKVLTPE